MAPVINAQNLFKRYAGFAPVLRGANIQVEPGEMVAVMGPSGCGKSTMLHILGLLHAPDSGTLTILDTNVLALNREQTAAFRRGNMGFVMQASNLFEHSTVFENVEFPLIYENVPPEERWGRVIRALDLVHLSARVHYPSNRLSGGEQQRVAIARAMVNNPRILLADEPTGALDARTSRLIMDNFRNLCHAGGVAMVMVTHDPAMADFCDTVYTLADGTLHCQKKGTPPFTEKSEGPFLAPPVPDIYGAFVTSHFPRQDDPDLGSLAKRLYDNSLLTIIYALQKYYFQDNSRGYSLPLAVKRVGFFARLMSFRIFFNRARSSESIWKLWHRLPARLSGGIGLRKRLSSFASGALLARWALRDEVRFFFASGAGSSATAAWVASTLLRLPFAFQINASDLARVSANWRVKGAAAQFVICPSKTVLEQVKTMFDTVLTRLLLIYPPPPVIPAEEELENVQTRGNAGHIEIVTTCAAFSGEGWHTVIEACKRLKQGGVSFRLTILGKVERREKKFAEKASLKMEMQYLGKVKPDNIAESFKLADIFIACEPADPWEKMIIPVLLREALAYRVAVAASGMSSGMAEILQDGRNCLAAPAANAQTLVANLERLCKAGAERTTLAKNGRQDLLEILNLAGANLQLADLMAMAVATAADKSKPGSDNAI